MLHCLQQDQAIYEIGDIEGGTYSRINYWIAVKSLNHFLRRVKHIQL